MLRKASGLDRRGSANVRESDVWLYKTKQGTVIFDITAEQTASYLGIYNPLTHLFSRDLIREYEQILEELMNRKVYGHTVKVKFRRRGF